MNDILCFQRTYFPQRTYPSSCKRCSSESTPGPLHNQHILPITTHPFSCQHTNEGHLLECTRRRVLKRPAVQITLLADDAADRQSVHLILRNHTKIRELDLYFMRTIPFSTRTVEGQLLQHGMIGEDLVQTGEVNDSEVVRVNR